MSDNIYNLLHLVDMYRERHSIHRLVQTPCYPVPYSHTVHIVQQRGELIGREELKEGGESYA